MALYADIVEIVAPDRAAPGSRVDVTVRVTNLHSDVISIMAGGALEFGLVPWPGIVFPDYWANVTPGETWSCAGWFIMPERAVTVHVYSYWYGSDGLWHFDDEDTKAMALTELRYEFDIGTPAVSAA